MKFKNKQTGAILEPKNEMVLDPVSYTHLTLPTTSRV